MLVVERLLEAQRLAAGERMVGMDREPEPVLAIGQVLEAFEVDRVPADADRGQAVAQMADDVARLPLLDVDLDVAVAPARA